VSRSAPRGTAGLPSCRTGRGRAERYHSILSAHSARGDTVDAPVPTLKVVVGSDLLLVDEMVDGDHRVLASQVVST